MSKKRRNKLSTLGSKLTTVISVALVLLIVGMILNIMMLTSGASDTLRSNVSVIVRMTENATDEQIHFMGDLLKDASFVSTVIYNSPDDILRQEVADNSEILDLLDENPFSPEFEVYLHPLYVEPDSIAKIAEMLSVSSAVDEVYSPIEVVRNVNSILRQSTLVLICIGVVFLIIAIVLLANTISLVIYSRRFVIHTMQLVGATRGFIRRPFVAAGAGMGVLAGLVASIILCAGCLYCIHMEMDTFFFVGWYNTACICCVLVLAGVLLCAIASFFATNRYLSSSYDELYS